MKLIGITGGSGSGKTTFASKVISKLPQEKVSMLSMDSYYLPEQPKEYYTKSGRPNYDHPKAFDWDLLQEHIVQLKEGQSIEVPNYDFKTSRRLDKTTTLTPTPVILFEGIFTLFNQIIRDQLDIKCFLHVEADIRFTRRLNRDVAERGRSLESVINQYYDSVRPMYEKFLAPQRQHADFIVGEETDVASEILSARLLQFIDQNKEFELLLNSTKGN
ncbi:MULTISPECIES: uridine kinase [Halobacteriovorax]|uniref:uridine/cytidine kinase n=1 Tax=Halobacteriovorax vibrionivorans TaxID=2152716 RepID=A0ABY0IMP0_9BACT|nr:MULTISPECIES: uridine kinase [Halobacteriovorax]AYF43125.1 putative uridine kinase [Halobacteriovorax sp. BALOs_7]RZF23146.1 uridine kinase [Halobacteriovorax vibrionivorans]TGD45946.1 uridine kinase [Halobacteriovorax sp. Y22]